MQIRQCRTCSISKVYETSIRIATSRGQGTMVFQQEDTWVAKNTFNILQYESLCVQIPEVSYTRIWFSPDLVKCSCSFSFNKLEALYSCV